MIIIVLLMKYRDVLAFLHSRNNSPKCMLHDVQHAESSFLGRSALCGISWDGRLSAHRTRDIDNAAYVQRSALSWIFGRHFKQANWRSDRYQNLLGVGISRESKLWAPASGVVDARVVAEANESVDWSPTGRSFSLIICMVVCERRGPKAIQYHHQGTSHKMFHRRRG